MGPLGLVFQFAALTLAVARDSVVTSPLKRSIAEDGRFACLPSSTVSDAIYRKAAPCAAISSLALQSPQLSMPRCGNEGQRCGKLFKRLNHQVCPTLIQSAVPGVAQQPEAHREAGKPKLTKENPALWPAPISGRKKQGLPPSPRHGRWPAWRHLRRASRGFGRASQGVVCLITTIHATRR